MTKDNVDEHFVTLPQLALIEAVDAMEAAVTLQEIFASEAPKGFSLLK